MAARFWVGGTGSWSQTAHWSLTSGGAGGEAVPTAADDVTFDAASDAAGYTVTIDATTKVCNNLVVGQPAAGTLVFTGSIAINPSGNLSFAAGVDISGYTGTITMLGSSGTKTISWGGGTFMGSFTFNGAATFQMLDAFTMGGASKVISYMAGTLDWATNTVTFTASGTLFTTSGAFTFYNYTRNGTTGVASQTTQTGGNITVANNFTLAGNSLLNRILYTSNVDSPRVLTCNGTVSVTNADFRYISVAGTGSWDFSADVTNGDAGGNIGFTFCASQDNYWVPGATSGAGAFGDAANHWANSDGGAAGSGRAPLAHDRSFFTSNSFTAGSKTVTTADVAHFGGDMDWNGVTNAPTMTLVNTAKNFYGSFRGGTFSITGATTGTMVMRAPGADKTFTQNGATFDCSMTINHANTVKITMMDAVSISGATGTGQFTLTAGTIDFGGFSFTAKAIQTSGSTARTVLNPGLLIATGTGNAWNNGTVTSLTADFSTATVKFTNSSATNKNFTCGGTHTYREFWIATGSTGTTTINATNHTFTTLRIDSGRPVIVTASNNITIGTPIFAGSTGDRIVFTSSTPSTAYTFTKSAATPTTQIDWCDFTDCTGSVANVWYVGANSLDTARNTNLIFKAAPGNPNSMMLMGVGM